MQKKYIDRKKNCDRKGYVVEFFFWLTKFRDDIFLVLEQNFVMKNVLRWTNGCDEKNCVMKKKKIAVKTLFWDKIVMRKKLMIKKIWFFFWNRQKFFDETIYW